MKATPLKEQIFQQLHNAKEPAEVRSKLRLLEEQFPQLILPRQLEDLLKMAMQVLFEGQSPSALKKGLKKFPATSEPLVFALAQLGSLLARLDIVMEPFLDSAGRLQALPASRFGALFIDCLEQICVAARKTWPEVPSPGEAVSWFWPVQVGPAGGPALDSLREGLGRLTELDQSIETINAKIKLIDRINIFTDSPEEAQLKIAKAERRDAEDEWESAFRDYRDEAVAWRFKKDAYFVSDRLVSLLKALANVSTKPGRSGAPIQCPLLHAESLIPESNLLLERQAQVHKFWGDYASLVQEVCATQPGQGSLPEQLKARLGDSLNVAVQACELAESEHKEAARVCDQAQRSLTLLDHLIRAHSCWPSSAQVRWPLPA